MKQIKNNHSIADHSATEVRKMHKHDANVQKNTTLYFQVGLIICLLAVHALFEMQFETKIPYDSNLAVVPDEFVEVAPPDFTIYEEPNIEPEPELLQQKKVITDEIKVVKDDHVLLESKLITQDQNVRKDKPADVSDIIVDIVDIPLEVPFYAVEKVPVFPGCEDADSNAARRECMSDKINKLIRRKFDGNIASEHGLSGIQKIDVQFKIDKTGKVVDVKARAPHPALAKEAQRVINKIPEMKPGQQQGKPVGVIYLQPIKFKVQD